MQAFDIEIEALEELHRVVHIEAESSDAALGEAERMYHDEKIVLDPGDIVDVEFNDVTERSRRGRKGANGNGETS